MKKKLLAVLISVCLIAVGIAVFTACGDDDTIKPRYSYYSFEAYEDGLILSVSNRTILPHGSLTLPTQSYFYPDVAGGEVKEHETPKPVIKIADGAFAKCDLITSVTIGDSYRELGEGCFEKCTNLESVIFPTVSKNDEAQKIAIPSDAFKDCNKLRSITGNLIVTSVGDRAFYSCLDLSTVEFQWEKGFEIGDEAFFYCISLHNLDVSDAGKIGADAFKGSAIDPNKQ